MGDAGFFKGTSSEQDTRFKDKEKSLLKSINFPKELDKKVDMRKVELSVMRPWIAQKIMELLGFEDEVVVEYVNGLLEDPASPIVDPKKMQINLTGFLESKTAPFMSELWALLLSAQDSPLKVPALFIEQKKEELRKREEADQAAQAAIRQRQQQEEEKERKLAEIRRRERGNDTSRRSRDQLHNSSQRPGSRTNGGTEHGFRNNFMPPRERDSGWGNRAGRLPEDGTRGRHGPPPSARRWEPPRSPPHSRRESYRDRLPEYRGSRSRSRSRSSSRSRSRSRSSTPPDSRRRYARRSPSPRAAPRLSNSSRPYRRGSPIRDHRSHDHRSHRAPSASSSPPPKRPKGGSDEVDGSSSRRPGRGKDRPPAGYRSRLSRSPEASRPKSDRPRTQKKSKSPRGSSPSKSSRSRSPRRSRGSDPEARVDAEAPIKKPPAVISIKGRASKANARSTESTKMPESQVPPSSPALAS